MNSLVLLVIGIMLAGMAIGYVKIFARKFTMFMVMLFSVYVTIQYAPVVNNYIVNNIDLSKAEKKITSLVDKYLDAKVEGEYIVENGETLSDTNPEMIQKLKEERFVFDTDDAARINIIRNLEFPANITQMLLDTAGKYDNTYIQADSFAQYMARFFIWKTIKIVSYLLVLCILSILYCALDGAKNRLKDGLYSGYLNQITGAVLGFFGAVLIIWVLFAVVKEMPDQSSVAGIVRQINSSKLLSFIQENNMVESTLTCVKENIKDMIYLFKPENLNNMFQMS